MMGGSLSSLMTNIRPLVFAVALLQQIVAQAPAQFAMRTPAALVAATLREGVAADFDNDGDLDLCGGTGLFSSFRQAYLRNDGNEQWTNVSFSLLPVSSATTLATVALDYDNDGDEDLFVSKQLAASSLWNNNGAGAFTDASAGLPALANDHLAAAAADFDGDGFVDLALMQGYFGVTPDGLLANNGSGGFSARPLALGPQTTSITTGDIDLDGDIDIVVGSYSGPRVYRNDGNFVFIDVSPIWLTGVSNNTVLSVALGDLNGDGWLDLVCGRQNINTDLVLMHSGATGFVVPSTLPTQPSGTKSIALFDCDEDGDLDVVRGVLSSPPLLHINDGAGLLTNAPGRMPVLSNLSPRILPGDYDGDGDIDLVMAEEVLLIGASPLLINRHRDLVPTTPTIGQNWTVDVFSEPGYATLDHMCRIAVATAVLPQPIPVLNFGQLWLDLSSSYNAYETVAFANVGVGTFTFFVPPLPVLIGTEMHLQAVVEQARAPARFTAYRVVLVQ